MIFRKEKKKLFAGGDLRYLIIQKSNLPPTSRGSLRGSSAKAEQKPPESTYTHAGALHARGCTHTHPARAQRTQTVLCSGDERGEDNRPPRSLLPSRQTCRLVHAPLVALLNTPRELAPRCTFSPGEPLAQWLRPIPPPRNEACGPPRSTRPCASPTRRQSRVWTSAREPNACSAGSKSPKR